MHTVGSRIVEQWGYGVAALVAIVLFLTMLAVKLVVCFLLYDAFMRLPDRYRRREPWTVWLLLVPCFSLFWNFFVFPALSESYRRYFADAERTDTGDAGLNLAWGFCVTRLVASLLPCLGAMAGVAALILLILYLVTITRLKGRIATSE